MAGGIVLGARTAHAGARVLAPLMLAGAAGFLLLAAAPGVAVLYGLLFLAGVAIAPGFSCIYGLVGAVTPVSRLDRELQLGGERDPGRCGHRGRRRGFPRAARRPPPGIRLRRGMRSCHRRDRHVARRPPRGGRAGLSEVGAARPMILGVTRRPPRRETNSEQEAS